MATKPKIRKNLKEGIVISSD